MDHELSEKGNQATVALGLEPAGPSLPSCKVVNDGRLAVVAVPRYRASPGQLVQVVSHLSVRIGCCYCRSLSLNPLGLPRYFFSLN